ncbi:hypothetical protein [Archangium lipolyticum]|uniref:hypothetical protein n=1 Tax=Archangium lipolyticum TaxID=2970465 RepID=UPI002149C9AF|nr:hypothetical protein [Archangium lipolyticum]
MADEKTWKGGRLGPFHISKRYKNVAVDLGRLYEAENIHTGAPALVLMPGARANWEPEDSWLVRISAQTEPPFITMEVEQAPSSGQLSKLSDMLDLLTSTVERLEKNEEARAHLTGGPVGTWKRWVGRTRRMLRSRGWLVVAGLAVTLSAVMWSRFSQDPEGPRGDKRAGAGIGESAASEAKAPDLVDLSAPGATTIAYPLPAKPFSDQAKAPCYPKSGEVEINGGCWVALEKRPPCYERQAEYQGKCYMPVSARSHQKSEPRSLQP